MRPDREGAEAGPESGSERPYLAVSGDASENDSATSAPAAITITVWFDRDLDINTNGMPAWLAQAALARAYELLEPSVFDLTDEADEEEGDED